jgi:peptidylamidoglycolate lyase
MKRRSFLWVLAGIVLLAFLGLAWTAERSYFSPSPIGDAYSVNPNWPRLPDDFILGQIAGMDIDSQGRLYVFHRGARIWEGEPIELVPITAPTVLVLNSETGEMIEQWDAGEFVMPHGLRIDSQDNIWITDVGLQQVFKFDRNGNLLMLLGQRGVAGKDSTHFDMPTDVAVAPDGSFYVSDGYGNSRVVKFSAEGKYILSWGEPGTEPGQFDVPHSIAVDSQGHVYVADRGNARIQIFDENGQFLQEWRGRSLGRPWALRFDSSENLFVVDGGDQNEFWPDRARIIKLDPQGETLASFGSYGREPGQFIWPHTIAVGPDGAIYVGEAGTGMRIQKFTK